MTATDNISPMQFKLKHEGHGQYTHEPDVPNRYAGQYDSHGDEYVSRHPVEGPLSEGSHMITAHVGKGRGKARGILTWDRGVIQKVDVDDDMQHKGMATQMYEHAKTITPGLAHSNNRTDAGEGWAKAVGGPRPPRMQDELH
jgi:hypothetical protein